MKLKGLTKLALSGVALAAVAATLGTSTYAWYVSNSKAEVSNISGQSNTQAAGSLLINKLKVGTGSVVTSDASAWTNKIALNDTTTLAFAKNTALNPVTRDAEGFVPAGTGKTAADATGWHDVANNAIAKTDAYGYFLIGIKTTDTNKRKVNMNLSIKNVTTGTLPAQTAYADAGLPDNVQVTDSFTQDFIYALKFDYHWEEIDSTGKLVTEYLTEGTPNSQDSTKTDRYVAYNADTFKNYDNASQAYQILTGAVTGGNAHTYYKALSEDNVTGTSINGGEADGGQSFTTQTFTLPDSTKEYVLVFRYWLDGADQDCFDSCISQKFQLKINLETVANNA